MARPRVRNRILEAAHELFTSDGAAALTTRAVAERAGVTEASVFNNFGDKTGLVQALIRETLPQLRELMGSIQSEPETLEQWFELLYLAAINYFLVILPLTAPSLQQPPGKIAPNQAKGFYTPRLAISERLKTFQQFGLCPADVDTSLVAKVLMGTAMHTATTRITLNDSSESETLSGRKLAASLGLL
ncbi:MAG: TetR/AcrR family transcriptional regulator [Endozoicomonas sp.]